jgi:hypothetical protein
MTPLTPATTNGTWSWWRKDGRVVVGWLRPEAFGDDIPVLTVHNPKDAGLVIALLDYVDARPVIA